MTLFPQANATGGPLLSADLPADLRVLEPWPTIIRDRAAKTTENRSRSSVRRLQRTANNKSNSGRIDMRKSILAAIFALPMLGANAAAQETLKIGYIDPLSGGGASIGEIGLKIFQFLADEANAKGGIQGKKVEIVPLDNKTNPQESLIQAQKAIDAGVRYITQGNGSSVAGALSDFVTKYNERNPGKEVLYFNYAAVDPVLTNAKCSFWHFRWDANSDIKMEALTNYMKTAPAIKNVYLINQDYSFGESVRSSAKAMLAAKRPDIKIVGDELHPLLKITDFAPYIAKIKASGADTVVTGNWGQDFALLLKAAADAGLKVNWYTYYAGGTGGPTAIKQANLNHQVFQITEGFANIDNAPSQAFEKALRARYADVPTNFYPRAVNEMRMFALAAERTKSLDPVKVASALEGMEFDVFDGGKGFMRKDDHQFFQPMYIASFGDRSEREPFDEEKTGWGWKLVAKIDTPDTVLPTTCKMERPN
jgi:branched-chain amino acid transport system substrate-binding protein